jgi:hypothetical protein
MRKALALTAAALLAIVACSFPTGNGKSEYVWKAGTLSVYVNNSPTVVVGVGSVCGGIGETGTWFSKDEC